MKTFDQYLSESIDEIYYHITPTKNVKSILKNGLEPRIGELSKDIGEEEPKIYLFKTKDAVEDGWANWMEPYFDEDEPITVLKITIPHNQIEIKSEKNQFEVTTKEKILPEWISTESGIEI